MEDGGGQLQDRYQVQGLEVGHLEVLPLQDHHLGQARVQVQGQEVGLQDLRPLHHHHHQVVAEVDHGLVADHLACLHPGNLHLH